jgi:hypothetical protein
MTPEDYTGPRPEKPIPRVGEALEAAHWAAIVFAFMLAVLSLSWAMAITTPDRMPHPETVEQTDFQ